MDPISTPPKWRIRLMQGLYFLNFISLFYDNWATILFPGEQMDTLTGVAISFWAGFSFLNLIGIRFPLKLLSILFLQLLYKSCWIIGTYWPAKISGALTAGHKEFLWICVAGIVLNILIIPWSYVYREYIKNFFQFNHKKLKTEV